MNVGDIVAYRTEALESVLGIIQRIYEANVYEPKSYEVVWQKDLHTGVYEEKYLKKVEM